MPTLAGGLPGGLGPLELGIILLIVVVLFGATRLTDIGKNLGRGSKEFRKEMKDEDGEDSDKEPAATAGEDKKS
jgi:sec-independent protein translocase protein TatA